MAFHEETKTQLKEVGWLFGDTRGWTAVGRNAHAVIYEDGSWIVLQSGLQVDGGRSHDVRTAATDAKAAADKIAGVRTLMQGRPT